MDKAGKRVNTFPFKGFIFCPNNNRCGVSDNSVKYEALRLLGRHKVVYMWPRCVRLARVVQSKT